MSEKAASGTLILVPARSGSTRVKNKNVRPLGGRPLLGHAVATGLESGLGRVIVSTNSEETAAVARDQGAETPFLRPDALSHAQASSRWVILHALAWFSENENWRPELIAYCPPTNPFTKASTLSAMADTLRGRSDVNSIVTITEPRTHPFRVLSQGADGRIQTGIVRLEGKTVHDVEMTQDWPKVWEGSPACRMTRASYFESLLATGKPIESFPGSTYDSANCLGFAINGVEATDIDGEEDWLQAEALFKVFRQPAGFR